MMVETSGVFVLRNQQDHQRYWHHTLLGHLILGSVIPVGDHGWDLCLDGDGVGQQEDGVGGMKSGDVTLNFHSQRREQRNEPLCDW